MTVLGVDPGDKLSALVWYDPVSSRVLNKAKIPNKEAKVCIKESSADHLAIEMAESFGVKVWGQVFTTVFWTGRFVEAWPKPEDFTLITRREVKMHLTNSAKAKDAQIRNCLIERWGGKDKAIGNKKNPGPLWGITADCWQALAIAVTYSDLINSSGRWRCEA